MKRIFTLILALSLLALTACSGGGTGETDSLTPEERTQRFVTAITDARSEEDNEYNSILSSADDDTADMTFQLLGVTTEDMESFAISVSLMNVKAYGIAVIKPAQDSEDTVKEGLQGFIDQQQQNFHQQHQLTPVDGTDLLELPADCLGGCNPQPEGAQGEQIVEHAGPVAGEQVLAQQHDISGLRIGKYLPSGDIGVGILQSPGDGEQGGGEKGLRHLPVLLFQRDLLLN